MNDATGTGKIVRAKIKEEQILIVDDETDALEYMQRSLAYYGFNNVQVATIAEEALEILCEDDIALALIDLRMPGKGGLWLLRKIRELQTYTAAVVVSASREFQDVKEALNCDADSYLNKPIRKEELCRTTTTVLEKRHLTLSNQRFQKKLESAFWDQENTGGHIS